MHMIFLILTHHSEIKRPAQLLARVQSLAFRYVGQGMVVAGVPESLSARVRFSPAPELYGLAGVDSTS
jgi:hypothetical protein